MPREPVTSVCEHCDVVFKGKRKFCTDRCKKMQEVKAKGTTKFLKGPLAKLFQKMVRAEYGAQPTGYVQVMKKGRGLVSVHRHIGQCVCVTCGRIEPWSTIKGVMNTGHFVASRRASILLEEENVAPQCSFCNQYGSGEASLFRIWMEAVRGIDVIEQLERLKTASVSFDRDELVDRWFQYSERLKAAIKKMGGRS